MSAIAREAESDEDIERCHPVLHQLRPHVPLEGWLERVHRQQASGYRLGFVEDDGRVVAVAGFLVRENLPDGVHLHVDDLVTDSDARSSGHGELLLDWLKGVARREGCKTLNLESGVQRFAAHRFYLRHRMEIRAHHFGLSLEEGEG